MDLTALPLTIVISILTGWFVSEFMAWAPLLARMLLKLSILLVPAKHRDRLREEFLVQIADTPGAFGKIIQALSLCIAGPTIYLNENGNKIGYRARDIFSSVYSIIILMPLILVIYFIVKIAFGESGFVKDAKVGLNGKPIHLLSFRVTGGVRSPFGRLFADFLVRSDFNHIPLLINVAKGDLSIVGPMPHSDFESKIYLDRYPQYMRRHSVRPGLCYFPHTNLFGQYGECDLQRELEYIDSRTILSDLKHIFASAVHLLMPR